MPKDNEVHNGPLSLIPWMPLFDVANAFGDGNTKYDPHDWRHGEQYYSTRLDAAMRHIARFNEGEDNDPKTNIPHLAYAIADLLMVLEYQRTGLNADDRYTSAYKPISEEEN